MVEMKELIPVFDRILMISWLCKDFGWMTTNVYLGFPFGFISVSLHLFLMFMDPRRSFRFYNVSLFFWVTANFIWMLLEFTTTQPSSHVHIGPRVPIGGISDVAAIELLRTKTVLFFFAAFVQIVMYLGIYLNLVDMPEEEDEDIICKNEAQTLFGGISDSTATDALILKGENSSEDRTHDISLAFIENAYIIFWISKDLFWSWGTGDLTHGKDGIIFYESTAMLFGTLSILVYCITAYIYRRNIVMLADAITTICWISANYVWMCGEFFLRYDNLLYDDVNEHDDSETRVASSILFCTGIAIQLGNILYLSFKRYRGRIPCLRTNRQRHTVEMVNFGPIIPSFIEESLHGLAKSRTSLSDNTEEILF